MAEHTPGPWSANWIDDGGEGWYEIVAESDEDGRRVVIASTISRSSTVIDTRDRANTPLIVAAPELLDEVITAALKAESDLDGMTCDAGNWDGGSVDTCEHCQIHRYLVRLNALIARATGKDAKPPVRGLGEQQTPRCVPT